MRPLKYRRRLGRTAYYREWMVGRSLRRRVPDFNHERPMVSIIGDHVSDVIRAEQVYERDILEFLRDRVLDRTKIGGQVALDVGANIGNHSLFFSDLFERVIAFEPNAITRALLKMNLDLNAADNVEVQPIGLSDGEGTATLQFDPINIGAASTSGVARIQGRTRQSVIELRAGDSVVKSTEPVGLIKVDVEGAEEAVLKGLNGVLQAHLPVVMLEQWPEVIDAESGSSPVVSYMRSLGYSVWEIERTRTFRGALGKIATLLLGHVDYQLTPISRLDQREYPALIFAPPSYLPPQDQSDL
jgi:FkbM family methyltransferase